MAQNACYGPQGSCALFYSLAEEEKPAPKKAAAKEESSSEEKSSSEEESEEEEMEVDEAGDAKAGKKRKANGDAAEAQTPKKAKIDEVVEIFIRNIDSTVEDKKIKKFFSKNDIEVSEIRRKEGKPMSWCKLANAGDLDKVLALNGTEFKEQDLEIQQSNTTKKGGDQTPKTPKTAPNTPQRNLREGDLVLLVEEASNRNQWPMGIVSCAIKDKDGLVRKVKLRVSNAKSVARGDKVKMISELERPVQRVVLLVPISE